MEAMKPQLPQKREVIASKYEQGCRGQAQVARPEDEDINTRPFITYLGILQEKMLPRDRVLEAQHRYQEIHRVEKWMKMTKHWAQYQSSKKLQSRIYKGIPLPMRGKVWCLLLDIEKVKAENTGKYQQMKEQGQLLSQYVHEIDADVQRTFQNHVMFQQRYGIKQQALFHVLLAYTVFDHEVGYRHGMNWVAAVLLMFLEEEDTFWVLAQLMMKPRHAMHGLYKANGTKLQRLQQHHDNILKCRVPKLKQHLDEQGVCAAAYARKWFQQCFVDGAPFPLMLRFFDVYILEGEPILTAMSYTALKVHRRHLLKQNGSHLQQYLQEELRQAWDIHDDAALRRLQATKAELEKFKCFLPPPAKLEEMPSMSLSLKLASLVPGLHPTPQRHRVGWRQNQVGCTVASDSQVLRTRAAAQSQSDPGHCVGTSSSGHRGGLSQRAFIFTPVLSLNAGKYRSPEHEPKKRLLGSPHPAQKGPRSSREAWSRARSAAHHCQKPGRDFTLLEPSMTVKLCSSGQPRRGSVKVLRVHSLPRPDLGQHASQARPGRTGVLP